MGTGWFIAGLVWAVALGLALGNYACTLTWRLPRDESPFKYKPRCGDCGTELKPQDLLPVVSWLMLKGACRYCGVKIPPLHMWTELAMASVVALAFIRFGFSETMILLSVLGFCLIVLSVVDWEAALYHPSMWVGAFISAMLLRTLQEHSIYNFLFGALLAAIAGLAWWRKSAGQGFNITQPPRWLPWLLLAGVVLNAGKFLLFAVYVVLYFLLAKKITAGQPNPAHISVAAASGIMLQLLLPLSAILL